MKNNLITRELASGIHLNKFRINAKTKVLTVNNDDVLVMWPMATMRLLKAGVRLTAVNEKSISGRRLTEYKTRVVLGAVTGEVPDVEIYDFETKQWISCNCNFEYNGSYLPDITTIRIEKNGKLFKQELDTRLYKYDLGKLNKDIITRDLLKAWVYENSSCKFK